MKPVVRIATIFARAGYVAPAVKVSVVFASKGGIGRHLGLCWPSKGAE